MPRKQLHNTHKYEKVDLGREKPYLVYKCILPECTHYVPVHLAEGKASMCWRCGERHIVSKKTLLLKRPHCDDCTMTKREAEKIAPIETVTALLDKLGLQSEPVQALLEKLEPKV